jgi:hypothetical protein
MEGGIDEERWVNERKIEKKVRMREYEAKER